MLRFELAGQQWSKGLAVSLRNAASGVTGVGRRLCARGPSVGSVAAVLVRPVSLGLVMGLWLAVGGCQSDSKQGSARLPATMDDTGGDSGGELDGSDTGGAGADSSVAEPTGGSAHSADGGQSDSAVPTDSEVTPDCGGPCPDNSPICDLESQQCVRCLADFDCVERGEGLFCENQHCWGCKEDSDCTDPLAARCDIATHRCARCTQDAECVGVVEGERSLDLCDPVQQRCVECTGIRYDNCGVADDGVTPLVCDSSLRRCSAKRARSEVVCGACVSDAECGPGMACVHEVQDGMTLPPVCLWTVDLDDSRFGSCTVSAARPYNRRRAKIQTVDGRLVDVCSLVHASCEALGQFVVASCADAADRSCGQQALDLDGLCRPFDRSDDDSQFRCTLPCTVSDDCPPQHACNREGPPSYCDLLADTCYTDADCGPEGVCQELRWL